MQLQNCKNCNKEFLAKTKWQKYCSDSCRINSFYMNKAKEQLLKETSKND